MNYTIHVFGAPGEVHHPVLYSSIMCKLLVYNYTMTIETSNIQISVHIVYKYPVITKLVFEVI